MYRCELFGFFNIVLTNRLKNGRRTHRGLFTRIENENRTDKGRSEIGSGNVLVSMLGQKPFFVLLVRYYCGAKNRDDVSIEDEPMRRC